MTKATKTRILLALTAACTVLPSGANAAYRGDSDTERDAVVAVVKATENRRYLYRTRLNPQAGTYQFVSAQVEVYDTKEVLRTTQGMDAPQQYTPASPLRSIADFIEELLTTKQQPPR